MPAGAFKFLKNDILQEIFGAKGSSLGALGTPSGQQGEPQRLSGGPLNGQGAIWGDGVRPAKSSVCIANDISNADPRNSIPALPVAQNSSPDLRGSWPRTAARDPPNTRAGGQDDVSS